MADWLMQLRRRLQLRHRYRAMRWLVGRGLETLRFVGVRSDKSVRFHVVSSCRNASEAAVACLQSVYDQRWPRSQVRHVFIDDASTDDTEALVRDWLSRHPDHNVEYIRRSVRQGGAVNNLAGFEKSAPDDIVAELNGDDWLPDPGVLPFLARVYADPEAWKTYNSYRFSSGSIPHCRPVPRPVVEANAFRTSPWYSCAMHTFRRKLYDHVDPNTMIDPETGEYWASADDQALYLAMLELAGHHARHLYRVTYVYNFGENSEHSIDRKGQKNRNARIRRMPRHKPLERL